MDNHTLLDEDEDDLPSTTEAEDRADALADRAYQNWKDETD